MEGEPSDDYQRRSEALFDAFQLLNSLSTDQICAALDVIKATLAEQRTTPPIRELHMDELED